jgi:hypothetical protein
MYRVWRDAFALLAATEDPQDGWFTLRVALVAPF